MHAGKGEKELRAEYGVGDSKGTVLVVRRAGKTQRYEGDMKPAGIMAHLKQLVKQQRATESKSAGSTSNSKKSSSSSGSSGGAQTSKAKQESVDDGVQPLTMERAKQLLTAGEKGISILFIPPSSSTTTATTAFQSLLASIYSRHRRDPTLHFHLLDDKLLSSQLLKALQLPSSGSSAPTVVAYRSHKGKYAVLDGGSGGSGGRGLDVQRMESWLDEVAGGGVPWKAVDLSKVKDYL